MDSKLMPKKREYDALVIKKSKWNDFMTLAHNYGFKDRDAENKRGELFRKEYDTRETRIRTEMDDDMEREIWIWVRDKKRGHILGGTRHPDAVRPYVADLIAMGYVKEERQ